MKKTTFLICSLAILSCFGTQAQITLTQSDMPKIGDAFQIAGDNAPTVMPGPSGTNKTWNLSALHNNGIDTFSFAAIYAVPYNADFPGANLAEVINLSGYPIYSYYNSSSSSLTTLGIVWPGFTIGLTNPAQTIMSLPATYGTNWVTTYKNINYYSSYTVGYDSSKEVQHAIDADTIDGWGSITTPAATYSKVLREKSITTIISDSTYYRDSATHIWHFETTNPAGVPSETFYWYANGIGSPVAELGLDTVGKMVHTAEYLYKNITGIAQVKNNSSALVYPNPASSSINIVVKSSTQNGYVKVMDITGREVGNSELTYGRVQLNTSTYASGMYIYLITDMNGNLLDKGKFTVTH